MHDHQTIAGYSKTALFPDVTYKTLMSQIKGNVLVAMLCLIVSNPMKAIYRIKTADAKHVDIYKVEAIDIIPAEIGQTIGAIPADIYKTVEVIRTEIHKTVDALQRSIKHLQISIRW